MDQGHQQSAPRRSSATTDELELDCLCTLVDLSVEAADFGQELLYFTDRPPALIPRTASSPPRGITTRSPHDPAKGKRKSEHVELCRKLVKARGKDKPVVRLVLGRSASSACSGGQQGNVHRICNTAPDEVKKGVEIVADVLCDWIDQLCARASTR